MIKVKCPKCGKRFRTQDHYAGKKARCSDCGAMLRIPDPPPESSPPPPEPSPPPSESSPPPPEPSPPPPESSPPSPVPSPPAPPEPAPTSQSAPPAAPAAATPKQPDEPATPSTLPAVALVLGIVGMLVPVVDIAAAVIGVIGITRFDPDEHHSSDRRKAFIGMLLGVIGFLWKLLALAIIGVLWYLSSQSQQQAQPPVAAPAPAPVPVVVEPPLTPTPPTPTPTPAPPPKSSGLVWYYDLNTGKLFTAKKDLIPPIDAPSGQLVNGRGAGVRAYVYSCGDCADPQQQYVAWYERATPNFKKVQERARKEGPMDAASDLDLDGLIDYLSVQYEISEDAKTWRGMNATAYTSWKMQKTQQPCSDGSTPMRCEP